MEKNPRKRTLSGIVVSDKMTRTVAVRIAKITKLKKLRRFITRHKKFLAHNDAGARTGDLVNIVETRPISRRKRWKVIEVVKKGASGETEEGEKED